MKNLKKILLGIFVALFVQQAAADDDKYKLKLSVSVTDSYIVIGARCGFQPNVYYRVMDGRYLNRYAAIQKESDMDPGRVIWTVYSSRNGKPDSAYVDENNNFLALPGEGLLGLRPPENLTKPRDGTVLATILPNSARVLNQWEAQRAVVAPLTVFDVIAKDLVAIHAQFIDLEDVDCAWLVIGNSFDGNRLHELRPLMSALKNAGFQNICLRFFGEEDEPEKRKKAYEELYSPLSLKSSDKCVPVNELHKDCDDGLAGLFGGGVATKAKGNIKTPTVRDIDMGGGGPRSAADVMKVVRQRTPGLRYIYNKFLKKRDGFSGRVVLKLRIAPSGEVVYISIESSTTGYPKFDASIKNAVSNWTFNKVDFGSTTVKIPFTFSEN